MNIDSRPYRQTARAAAAAMTASRILDSFVDRLQRHWLDEIRLDDVAADSGVTVQTVIRRFGGKSGLLQAASARLQAEIEARRSVERGNVDAAIRALLEDYENAGDLIVRVLAQEDRDAELAAINAGGRAAHRDWVAGVFEPWLETFEAAAREGSLDALVAATDVYIWKLVRRDMKRSEKDYARLVRALIAGALQPGSTPSPAISSEGECA